ncbi:hypothetical protein R1flu_015898 [Riccia fluitans]|uniref:Uncharacterized protein n=1 Tax=Riccia fluitans TaxID=41844 RepID=A0ABD1YND4_9MARC
MPDSPREVTAHSSFLSSNSSTENARRKLDVSAVVEGVSKSAGFTGHSRVLSKRGSRSLYRPFLLSLTALATIRAPESTYQLWSSKERAAIADSISSSVPVNSDCKRISDYASIRLRAHQAEPREYGGLLCG